MGLGVGKRGELGCNCLGATRGNAMKGLEGTVVMHRGRARHLYTV